MKVLMMTITIILAVLILVAGASYWVLSGSPGIGPAPRKTPAPDGFDAAAFVDFAALTSTGAFNIIDLSRYGNYSEHYHLPDLKVTYFILSKDDGTRVILFVDDRGSAFGTITQGPDAFPMGHYFIDKDGFYEVGANVVSDFHRHEVIEEPFSEDELTQMVAQSSHYRSFSWRDTDRDDPDHAAQRDTHVMRHDGVWKKLVMAADFHDWKGASFDDLDKQYHAGKTVLPENATRFFGGKYSLVLTHFDQQAYVRKRGAVMGSPTGQSTPEQWIGTGYYTLMAGNEALRFSISNDHQVLSGFGPVRMTLEGGQDLDFVVLKHQGHGQNPNVFVVSAH